MEDYVIVRQWLKTLSSSRTSYSGSAPTYWNENPASLLSTSRIANIAFGTGCSIYENSILPAISKTEKELVIVTCFWARSPTQEGLNDALRTLSAKCKQKGKKVRVRIYFSSSSLFQKLFHTPSLAGRTYSAAEQSRLLGLPCEDELVGLDLQVKSIFVLPFSVMHPKFIIIDRSRVFLPSCNISWEDWFEGCVSLSGPIVDQFMNFWKHFWAGEYDREYEFDYTTPGDADDMTVEECHPKLLAYTKLQVDGVQCIFLPSPHSQNPQFSVLPWQPCPPPPATPLNMFLLTAFANAEKHIYVQTPNLTSPPVLSALLAALKRGVDVTIVTSERLMILEQLVTAGTTTQRCVKKLIKLHKRLLRDFHEIDAGTIEAGLARGPGTLSVNFFRAHEQASSDDSEPVQSHVKVTIIDGEWTVLGSGNLDRASWYTSQELSVAFHSEAFASEVRSQLDLLMRHRTKRA